MKTLNENINLAPGEEEANQPVAFLHVSHLCIVQIAETWMLMIDSFAGSEPVGSTIARHTSNLLQIFPSHSSLSLPAN